MGLGGRRSGAWHLSVFIVPGSRVKNGDERLVVLNRVASTVIEARRGIDRTFVFTYHGRPITRMMTSAWKRARRRLGCHRFAFMTSSTPSAVACDAAGVSFEDRQDLLGHRSGRITTHYSAAELSRLIEAAEKVV